jgi:uncharacterized protein YndB with AHSA1/START domain
MRKKLLTVLSILGVALVGFLIFVALRPADYTVSRSMTVAAPAAVVFPHVNELKKWEKWNPWMQLDPNSTATYEGPAAGKGAAMKWSGNNNVGSGKMTVTESRPDELVRLHLEFYKPMAGTSDAEFTFKPEGTNTVVTWTMTGKNNFIAKAMCLFMDMDQMVGSQFEKGLSSMKRTVERP